MIRKIIHKINRGIRNPGEILPYLEKHRGIFSYYRGDGSSAGNPIAIKLYINAVCNATCVMCDIGQNNRDSVFYRQIEREPGALLSIDACARLINEVKRFKPEIHIHGLEPLLHNNLLDLISIIKQENLFIHLITNGILLASKAKDLIESDVDLIAVSIDGPAHIHDEIRGKDTYRKAVEGIRLLRHWRDRLHKKQIKIATNFTISNWNYHCLQEYAETMLLEEKVDFITLLHLSFVSAQTSEKHNRDHHSPGKASPVNSKIVRPEAIDTDILWSQVECLKKKFTQDQIHFNHDFTVKEEMDLFLKKYDSLVPKTKCKIPWKSATITANGDAIINNRCFEYKAGNIHEQTFTEIWNGERYQTFRRALKREGYFPACYRCCGRYYGW